MKEPTCFRDSFNLEAVEVQGPSSIYFGRGSTGGVINQVSKSPRRDSAYGGILSGASDYYPRGTIDMKQPLTSMLPNAALRINLMAHGNRRRTAKFIITAGVR
jgi:catecholate siderophore receptor